MTAEPPIPQGLFLTVEGGDGSGKTTFTRALAQGLRPLIAPNLLYTTREPGGTPLGEALRGLLRDRVDQAPSGDFPLSPMGQLLLISAAREHHVTHVIRPHMKKRGLDPL